jgi:hypothetical protein
VSVISSKKHHHTRRPYEPNSIEFIYQAMNALASGKRVLETEQCLVGCYCKRASRNESELDAGEVLQNHCTHA